ncbi:hypothetical protein J7L48_06210 [bacterium]|nr:hypothetical protein [bacterium]
MKKKNIEKWELNLLKNKKIEDYIRVSQELKNISTENSPMGKIKTDFKPLKKRIQKYILFKKIKIFIFIAAIISILIDLAFLKNIEEWTNFSQAMAGFIVFIFTLWIDKASLLLFKVLSLLTNTLNNSFILFILLIISLITLHFITKDLKLRKR